MILFVFVMICIDKGIEDIPEDVTLQRERALHLGNKLIDHIADDLIVQAPAPPKEVPLKEYKFYGSSVQFTPGTGYHSGTGSKSSSRHPSFSGTPTIHTSTAQTDASAEGVRAFLQGGADDDDTRNPIEYNTTDLNASLNKKV